MNDETGIQSDTGPFAIVPEWVLDSPVSDRAVRLYALLARFADKDDGTCFPSRALLAERLRCSVASVDRARDDLLEAGALRSQQRWLPAHNGKKPEQTTTLYTVLRVPRLTGDSTYAHGCDGELEPIEREPLNDTKNSCSIEFSDFWNRYPRRVGKRSAQTAFDKACARAGDPMAVVLGASRFASFVRVTGAEMQFVPHPATWLNRDGWEDDLETENQPRLPRGADATARTLEWMQRGGA